MFQVNEVLRLETDLYRVLLTKGNQVIWIAIDDPKAFPDVIALSQLEFLLLEEKLTRSDDPYLGVINQIPKEGSKEAVIRDTNYEIIVPLVNDPDFYVKAVRANHIRAILKSGLVSRPYLYKLLRRYWQRGQVPNALLPDYKNSGGKGQKREVKDKKLGRPRKIMEGVGASVNEETARLFRIIIDKYVLKKKFSIARAHRKLKTLYGDYFPDILESEKPTLRQMSYFYHRDYTHIEKLKASVSKVDFVKNHSPLNSTATLDALGPGSRYEIDATIADIILVSDSNRNQPVGRPTVYVVIDVFSRFIVGWYIGFENPSYVAAIQALHVAFTDKTHFFKQLGIDTDDFSWPEPGLPESILADRGELFGHQIEGLESGYKIRIENTPPFRGDSKGIVEQRFRTLQAEFKKFTPGEVTGLTVKKRGGKNYWLDGKLTISEFTEIIVSSIVMRNFVDPMKRYDRAKDMPADLPSVPIHLWNWGLKNRTGRLRKADPKAIRIALLPRSKASTSDYGICLFGVYYSSPEIIEQGWMHRSKINIRPKTVLVGYDPNFADEIYLFHTQGSSDYWVCRITDFSREFRELTFWEVWRRQSEIKVQHVKGQLIADKVRQRHEDRVEQIISSAIKVTPKTNATNAERLRGVASARSDQLIKERDQRRPQKNINSKSADLIHLASYEDCDDYPDFEDELFSDGED
ncbi:Mu transposase C-terminal domain-containing protein [Marinomonas foliarum]|uniref:Mu transposase-like protein n=1 Tax=Marinomonas foliarum TaxID=491950 RepID=A0A368ZMQ7_9GAMM|nr:Mu transposase C-terminal domain-containing protein [Marinomonas foliarum]RCW96334.1 Mu transposase-like protein [Marinomonas foliarum]